MNGTDTLAAHYRAVLDRIASAAKAAGRDPSSVRLLAVSKTFGADRVAALAAAGQRAFGENYLQEALEKIAALADLRPDSPLEWHFIGPIQSNKTRRIAEAFDWVHSVDALRIARRLSEQRPSDRPPLNLCLQVNVSGEASKGGCEPADTVTLAGEIAPLPGIVLHGLMAIPEPTDDAAVQSERFALLRRLLDDVRSGLGPDRAARLDTLSMGMSADLESAIAEGATIVRVGSALFGSRTR